MRYNTPSTPLDNLKDLMTRGGIPVTMTLLACSVALFLGSFFTSHGLDRFILSYVAFSPYNILHAPWTVFTYPIAADGFFNLLIGGFFFWLAGGSLERGWGSQRYAIFFFSLTAITALSLLLGYTLAGRIAMPNFLQGNGVPPMFGFTLPLSGMIVAFCMLNPNLTLNFYFVPVKAIHVAWIIAFLSYFMAGMGPVLSLFACGGIFASFLYVKFGRSWGDISSYSAPRRAPRGPDLRMDTRPSKPAGTQSFRTTRDGSPLRPKPFDIAGRIRDWRDRRKLEKLWRNSGLSDSEPEWRDDEKRRR